MAARILPKNPNATESRLNLGAHDWTIECWLRLDPEAADEGVIFEIGAGPRGTDAPTTRFSVLPRENALVLAGLTSAPSGVAPRIEFANPEGPPSGEAWRQSWTLALSRGKLPRGTRCHVALVHVAAVEEIRLYVSGRLSAVVAAKPRALPRDAAAYLAIGRDGAGQRGLRGALDELRVSDHAVYAQDFAPPESLADEAKESVRP